MSSAPEKNLTALCEKAIGDTAGKIPAVWNGRRRDCLAGFAKLGLPDAHTEGYRHAPLQEVFGRELVVAPCGDAGKPTELYTGSAGTVRRISLVNGCCPDGFLHEEADGTVWGSLREAAVRYPELAAKYIGASELGSTAESALNGAFASDGAFVFIPQGVRTDGPVLIDMEYTGRGLCFPRIVVAVADGGKAEVAVVTRSDDGVSVLANRVQEIYLGEKSRLEVFSVTFAGADTAEVGSGFVMQSEGSVYEETFTEVSEGDFSRFGRRIDLNGREAECRLRGLFMGGCGTKRSVDLTVNHVAPLCRSDQLVKGVVWDDGVGSFRGLVRVHRDAQKTEAYQQSRNVQLGDGARIYTEPQLEIYADDVKCSHGATVGRLDGESVFYMRQRGLSLADARRLQLVGFIRDIFDRCPYDALCGRISEVIDKSLERIL